jgi:riboflavin synthase
MFTGLIEGLGTVTGVRSLREGKRLSLAVDFSLHDSRIGDSIAVSGACLTAVAISGRNFEVDVSPETLAKTTLERIRVGEHVNIERAMRLNDRIDGHLVSGHIDGKGIITAKYEKGGYLILTVSAGELLTRYMIQKGSVAVDGISLTINECNRSQFDVSIIPHTAALTTVGFKQAGDEVNIETDMLGKYVERFVNERYLAGDKRAGKGIDLQFLAKHGYL